MLKRKSSYLVAALFLLAFFLRFYKLDQIPNGYREDETSLGYNAYSILKTGHDEHGAFMPQNFKAFGEYKLPGYVYASVVPVGIFGLNPWGIRFVAAFSGFLTVVVVYFLSKSLVSLLLDVNKHKKLFFEWIPILTTALLTINPWHLHFSRSAFEVTLANFFLITGVYLFLKLIKSINVWYGVGSLILFFATIYTYNIGRLFAPLLLITFFFIFYKTILLQPKKYFAIYGITALICLIPFIIGAISRGGFDSTLGTLIFSSAKVQAPLQEFRSYFIEWPLLGKLFFNFWVLTFLQYVTNVFAHFSPYYFFIFGPEDGSTSFAKMGQWYLFELPLVIAGFVFLLKQKSKTAMILIAWIVSLVLISSLTRDPPQATRTFFLVFPITFCSSIGLVYAINLIGSLKKKYRIATCTALTVVIIYSMFLYFASYYVRFPVYYARFWRTADREVSMFIKDNNNKYDKFIIDNSSGFNYTSLLVYLQYPPNRFTKEANWNPEDSEGFTYPTAFGKFEFREVIWEKDLQIPNALIIVSVKKEAPNTGILKTITLPERPVVLNIGQTVSRYPYSEPVFNLIETGIE